MGPRVLTGPSGFSHWAITQPGPSFLLLLCSWNLWWPSESQQHDPARTSRKTDTLERFQRPLSMLCQFRHSESQCHCIQQTFHGHLGQVKVRGLGFQTSSLGPFFAYVYLHVWVGAYTLVLHAHRGLRSYKVRSSSNLHLNFWDKVAHRNLELTHSAKKAGQVAQEMILSFLSHCWSNRCGPSCLVFVCVLRVWTQVLIFVCKHFDYSISSQPNLFLVYIFFCRHVLTMLPKLAWNASIACLRQLHPGLMGVCSNDQLTPLMTSKKDKRNGDWLSV